MTQSIETIGQLLAYSAEKYAAKPCIKFVKDAQVISKTYAEFYSDSLSAAAHILSVLPKKTHIALIGKTSYGYLTYYNGIFISGNTVVPLASETDTKELSALIEKADVTAVIYDENVKVKVAELLSEKNLISIEISAPVPCNENIRMAETDPKDCAMIMFTSGTMGDKKGVMLSSRALVTNVMFREMSYEGDHVALNVLPMHHVFSFSCDYLKNIKDGVTICLNGNVENIFENLLLFEPTFIRLVPMMIETLLKRIKMTERKNPQLSPREAAERVYGKRLRSIIASGAYLSPKIASEYEKYGISVRQGYGMTETGPRIAVPNGKTSVYSVGAVIDICDIRIQDGEIQVKSPSLMSGYYKDPEATEAAFTKDGWFKTGDIGHVEEDGQLYVTGRKKNLIILSNGENVSPEEIEKKFYGLPFADELLVYGENNRVIAEFYLSPEYITRNSEETAKENILQAVNEYNQTAISEKEIADIRFRNIPFEKTASGKIKRKNITF